METIRWEVNYLSPPKAMHHCKKCGAKTEHVSSGLFRVNAQQKSLDVWLIYKCARCNTTWNVTIHSRINPKQINRDLLSAFTNNDSQLATQYAMDIDLLKKNGAETEEAPFEVCGSEIDLREEVYAMVQIVCDYPTRTKVAKILREKLSLSKKEFDELVARNVLRLKSGEDIKKCRLQFGTVVIVKGKR